jgi:hypothetical protein
MNKIIKIPQGNGNYITEIELPMYITIHKCMHVAFKGTHDDKVRRIYIDSLHGEISFKDYDVLHDMDSQDIAKALMLRKDYTIIQERDFTNILSQTIENINA